jgi:[ribosomal protein S18]-alanine N-acetyltransferase
MAHPGISLELATQSDAQAIAWMSRDLIETGLGWTYRRERIAQLIRDPDVVTLVARDGDQAIGFVVMRFGDHHAHLVLLAVRPSHQRRGIARRMMAWLVQSALIAGVMSIHVELRATNAAALALYEAIGFSETFRIPGYYGGREAALRMIRMLRTPGIVTAPWRPPTQDAH